MHSINELENILDSEDGNKYTWLDPAFVKGVNKFETFNANKIKWFIVAKQKKAPEYNETQDEIIADYLSYCIIERDVRYKSNLIIPPELDINGVKFVKALIYLINELGSSYASTNLSVHRDLINENDASNCFDLLTNAYDKADSFVKDIFRDCILSLFCYGPMWGSNKGTFYNVLNQYQNSKLKQIYKNGYLTKYVDWVAEIDYS